MAVRGMPCPDGHGSLYELNGRLWCAANIHGGNGRFFSLQEVEQAMAFAGTGPAPKPEVAKQRKTRSDAGKPRAPKAAPEVTAADNAAVARIERAKPEPVVKAEAPEPKPARAPRPVREPKACLCGCGGMTKGGTFLPGHDARYHAALKKLQTQ